MNKKLIFIGVLTLSLLIFLPFLGITELDPEKLFTVSSTNFIFWKLRVPRTILAFLAGSSLALCGLIMQNTFRNSLATPYTLGISSGASVGVVLAIKLKLSFSAGIFTAMNVMGFSGSLLSIALILFIAKIVKNHSIYTLLMSGVAVNFFFASLIVMIQYLFDHTQTISALRWMVGGISVAGYSEIIVMTPVYIILLFSVFLFRKEFLILSGGDSFAASKGINTKKFRTTIFIIISAVVGTVVTFVGPVGFVGLIVPHLARNIFKNSFSGVIYATALFGGLLLVIADYFARTLIAPAEIPAGIITSLLGAPFFIIVLVLSIRKTA